MNVKAECRNPNCTQYRIAKSVTVGQLMGYEAEKDRVSCPSCGEVMTTTQTINVSDKGRTHRRDYARHVSQGRVSRRESKRR
jgi:predicted RNA-binding Zn-ribbon protein involved in translation (DUF1610 family)